MVEIRIPIPTLDDLIPSDFRRHMRNAYREILLAFKSLIEREIERSEKKEVKKIEIS